MRLGDEKRENLILAFDLGDGHLDEQILKLVEEDRCHRESLVQENMYDREGGGKCCCQRRSSTPFTKYK